MRYLVTNVWSSDEDYSADCDYAVLEIRPKFTDNLRAHMAKAREQKAQDKDFWSLQWHDYSPTFVSAADVDLGEEEFESLASGEDFIIIERPDDWLEGVGQRLDFCVLVAHAGEGVFWQGIPKHTGLRVETVELRERDLKEIEVTT